MSTKIVGIRNTNEFEKAFNFMLPSVLTPGVVNVTLELVGPDGKSYTQDVAEMRVENGILTISGKD